MTPLGWGIGAAAWLLAGSAAAFGQPAASTTLTAIRVGSHPTYTRVVFELDKPAAYEWRKKAGANAFQLTLLDTAPTAGVPSTVSVRNPHLAAVTISRVTPTSLRAAITAKTALTPRLLTLDHPDRIVVDFYPVSATTGTSPPLTKTAATRVIRTIVIDPGHGGKDPGAIGLSGYQEKEAVLDIGRRLKKLLEQRGHRIIMTRNDDTFIPLSDRTQIANSRGADLFVSIHANAHPKRSTKGMQVYLLGKATDEEARAVAARENGDDASQMDDLDQIFNDMALDFRINHSISLAYQTHDAFLRTVGKRYSVVDLGVKRAPFYVLMKSDMPGILAEVSFISNPQEEARLKKAAYRQSIAEALARGVERYLAEAAVES
ncbi:MAG: N-acetylmuramoyl-L-alanine amidase [Nitrospirae bacterium]|nr:N-acetylmuramoyl-L-alanine amidase [Nitrospirota bacterium]